MGFEVDIKNLVELPDASEDEKGAVKVSKHGKEEGTPVVPTSKKVDDKLNKRNSFKEKEVLYYSNIILENGKPVMLVSPVEDEFLGRISHRDFIKGVDLAERMGVTEGVNSEKETNWLKFNYAGKILYIADTHIKTEVSWDYLNEVGLVTGNKTINIKGEDYKVRLIKGKNTHIDNNENLKTIQEEIQNSEWNNLMCSISEEAKSGWLDRTFKDDTVPHRDVSIPNEELDLEISTICQETRDEGVPVVILRGGKTYSMEAKKELPTVSYSTHVNKSFKSFGKTKLGWRPVLELVE